VSSEAAAKGVQSDGNFANDKERAATRVVAVEKRRTANLN